MELLSPEFANGGTIPQKYAGDGADVSPPLHWKNPPAGTASYALICDDPDAPGKTWVHWVMYNIPANQRAVGENVRKAGALPQGIAQGENDFGRVGYGGPLPPAGTHRYFFKLYALDKRLRVKDHATKIDVLKEMENHILEEAELVGTYTHRSRSSP